MVPAAVTTVESEPEDVPRQKADKVKKHGISASTLFRVKTSSTTWESILASKVMDLVEKVRAERKLSADGGNGVGPARTPKAVNEPRKAGKPRDTLVDDLIVETEEPVKQGKAENRIVVYCIGCLKKTAGRDPNRIKDHAQSCNVR